MIHSLTDVIKQAWKDYENYISNISADVDALDPGIRNWRDNLFAIFITYLIPVCFIALVPGIYMSVRDGYLFLALFDVFIALAIAFAILNKKVSNRFRKTFVILLLYVMAIVLMIFFGLSGPGMIYLLGLSLFVSLLFSTRAGFLSIGCSTLICLTCALVIRLRLFNSPLLFQYNLGAWIAISSNLIFLSWVSVALICHTIDSLERATAKEVLLRNELLAESIELAHANEQLKESEIHYKSLFFLNPSPMWILDYHTHQFLQVNDAAIQNYEYTNAEFLTMSIMDIKYEEDEDAMNESLVENLKNGIPSSIFSKHRKKNNTAFPVKVVFNSFLFMGKKALLAIAIDISEQMNYISAIEIQNKKLRQIAYIQSHLVRAPLARILGLVKLIIEDDSECNEELLSHLDESAKGLDQIIHTITDYTE